MVAAAHATPNPTPAKTLTGRNARSGDRSTSVETPTNPFLWRALSLGARPKLELSQPDDADEREADRFADAVMRSTADGNAESPTLRPLRVQRACAACEEEEADQVRRSAAGAAPDSVDGVDLEPASNGSALDSPTRAFFENRLGSDLADVRIHTDARAESAAAALHAHAFTLGSDIAFARGRYRPGDDGGRRLIAHELAHVVQQRHAGDAGGGPLPIGDQGDRHEREADVAADRAMTGGSVRLGSTSGPIVQRAVRETVVSSSQPGAQACLVHLHGDEENARQVALSLFGTHCTNLVDLSGHDRWLHVDEGSDTCLVDPNRIFSANGIAHHAFISCPTGRRTAAESDLIDFRDHQLIPALATCRNNPGGGLAGGLPVVAFHNNSGLSITDYRPGGSSEAATDTDPARIGSAPNPHVEPGRGRHDYLLTTDPRDQAALSAAHNVALQSGSIAAGSSADDGSLSVAQAAERYINIEGFGKTFSDRNSRFYITDMAMALDVLRQLEVGRKPCAGAGAGAGSPADFITAVVAFLDHLFGEIGRVAGAVLSLPDPLPTEALPAPPPRGCRVFADAAALDAHRADWATTIAGMSIDAVADWIIGVSSPPAAASGEAERQRSCLMTALGAAGRWPAGASTVPVSGYRSFNDQRRIWNRKFDFLFDRGRPANNRFDRITDHARSRCGSLIGAADAQWDTGNPDHRACWGAATLAATPSPRSPPAAGPLSDDEKAQEILEASSAPGISRHHFGTDFDFFSVEPVDWAPGGRNFDAYRWLRANAASWGFIQSFTPFSTFMRLGYMDERWHWSYYPIAEALLEFARSHQGDLEARLTSPARWGSAGRFEFIRAHWREFMFNVAGNP